MIHDHFAADLGIEADNPFAIKIARFAMKLKKYGLVLQL